MDIEKRILELSRYKEEVAVNEALVVKRTPAGSVVEIVTPYYSGSVYRISNNGFVLRHVDKEDDKLSDAIKMLENIVSEWVLLTIKEKDR